jgi:hypothetical protein
MAGLCCRQWGRGRQSLGSALAKYGVRDQGRIPVKGEERVRFLFSAAIPDEYKKRLSGHAGEPLEIGGLKCRSARLVGVAAIRGRECDFGLGAI